VNHSGKKQVKEKIYRVYAIPVRNQSMAGAKPMNPIGFVATAPDP
jgi:hypothetical protein